MTFGCPIPATSSRFRSISRRSILEKLSRLFELSFLLRSRQGWVRPALRKAIQCKRRLSRGAKGQIRRRWKKVFEGTASTRRQTEAKIGPSRLSRPRSAIRFASADWKRLWTGSRTLRQACVSSGLEHALDRCDRFYHHSHSCLIGSRKFEGVRPGNSASTGT